MGDSLKKEIEENMYNALPRFERYETNLLTLGGIQSVREF